MGFKKVQENGAVVRGINIDREWRNVMRLLAFVCGALLLVSSSLCLAADPVWPN